MYAKASKQGYTEVVPGISIKTLNYGEASLMVEFLMGKGAMLPEHSHPNEQAGYLVSGRFRITVAGRARVMEPGDSWCIPANMPHKAEILEDSVAVEVFAPRRDDYLKYAREEDLER